MYIKRLECVFTLTVFALPKKKINMNIELLQLKLTDNDTKLEAPIKAITFNHFQ